MVRADDGPELSLTLFEPKMPRTPRGVALLLHGFSQNRYAFLLGALPQVLLAAGLNVAIGELRGHGLSERPRRWSLTEHLHGDLPVLAQGLQAWVGDMPIHLMGHSMGGLLGFADSNAPSLWSSVTGIGAPLVLGSGSPLVGLAACMIRPLIERVSHQRVPVHTLLSGLSRPLSALSPSLGERGLQRLVSLANPKVACPQAIRSVLELSEPESMEVFREFVRVASGSQSLVLGKVDVLEAVRSAVIPVAALVGGSDIFAAPSGVDPLVNGAHWGPRRVQTLPNASHVDLSLAEASAEALVRLLPFLEQSLTAKI